MRLKYNAPATLSFALICALVLGIDQFLVPDLIANMFMIEGKNDFDFNNFPSYVRIITHVLGHQDWDHLMSNLLYILLLGPILEEKHGTRAMVIMIFLTALTNGVVNIFFFPTSLLGASGIVFMMILLISFTNIRKGEIPITFLLIVTLYLVQEFTAAFSSPDGISQISHIVGGVCGSLFGFYRTVIAAKTAAPKGPPAGGGGGDATIVG